MLSFFGKVLKISVLLSEVVETQKAIERRLDDINERLRTIEVRFLIAQEALLKK
jgi:hypothetical protein